MTNNTPLNAEDELREKIDEYLSHFEVSVDGMGDVGLFDLVHPRIKDKYGYGIEWAIVIGNRIMEAVLADRKKHELQARLEEYQQGLLVGASPEFIGKPMAEERIAELKQELENL